MHQRACANVVILVRPETRSFETETETTTLVIETFKNWSGDITGLCHGLTSSMVESDFNEDFTWWTYLLFERSQREHSTCSICVLCNCLVRIQHLRLINNFCRLMCMSAIINSTCLLKTSVIKALNRRAGKWYQNDGTSFYSMCHAIWYQFFFCYQFRTFSNLSPVLVSTASSDWSMLLLYFYLPVVNSLQISCCFLNYLTI